MPPPVTTCPTHPQAANRPTTRNPPVVPLLGYFVSAPTEEAASLSMDAEADSVWLVYRWEGMRPLNMFLSDVQQPQPAPSFFKKRCARGQVGQGGGGSCAAVSERSLAGGIAGAHAPGPEWATPQRQVSSPPELQPYAVGTSAPAAERPGKSPPRLPPRLALAGMQQRIREQSYGRAAELVGQYTGSDTTHHLSRYVP